MSGGFEAGGQWSIQFPRNDGIKCYAVVSGECWLSVEPVSDAVHLQTGDCFLLPSGRPFRLASETTVMPIDAATVFAASRNGGIAKCNGGGNFSLVGSYFALAGNHGHILVGMLPPIIHLRTKADREALRWAVEQMMRELREQQPGGLLMTQHLAHMMLMQALRAHLADAPSGAVGWLFALADKQIGGTITAMHQEPAHRWTLQSLAELAGMSRSSFAVKFKATVGTSPLEYLTRWRMLLAGDRLAHSSDPVSVICLSLGYESESAFSTAFKRVMGCSPRRYGRGPAPPQSSDDRLSA